MVEVLGEPTADIGAVRGAVEEHANLGWADTIETVGVNATVDVEVCESGGGREDGGEGEGGELRGGAGRWLLRPCRKVKEMSKGLSEIEVRRFC